MQHDTMSAAARYIKSPRGRDAADPQAALGSRLRVRRIMQGAARPGPHTDLAASILRAVRDGQIEDAITLLRTLTPVPAQAPLFEAAAAADNVVPFLEHAVARHYGAGVRLKLLCDPCKTPQMCTDADECRRPEWAV